MLLSQVTFPSQSLVLGFNNTNAICQQTYNFCK
uniref:Uncharacterized protein n=1 Tax=Rhizophora mucronata TaxID=61149 RepID=A0A2P2Q7G2_RHIMU